MTSYPKRRTLQVGILLLPVLLSSQTQKSPWTSSRVPLHTGWKLQSGCVANSSGEQISSLEFRTDGWIDTPVPYTVLGAQVDAGIFKDPFYGMDLRKISGTDYPIGKIFGYLPMSESSPYHCS